MACERFKCTSQLSEWCLFYTPVHSRGRGGSADVRFGTVRQSLKVRYTGEILSSALAAATDLSRGLVRRAAVIMSYTLTHACAHS